MTDFIVGKCNCDAYEYVCAIVNGYEKDDINVFYGDIGVGKKELLNVLAHNWSNKNARSSLIYESSESFINKIDKNAHADVGDLDRLIREYMLADLIVISNIQKIRSHEKARVVFEYLVQNGARKKKKMCFSYTGDIQHVRTVVKNGCMIKVDKPDYETAKKILKAHNEYYNIPKEWYNDLVLEYVAKNRNENVRILIGSWNKVIYEMKRTKMEKINLKFAMQLLEEFA